MKFIVRRPYIAALLLALIFTLLNLFSVYFPWISEEHTIIANSTSYKKKFKDSDSIMNPSPANIARDFLLIDISNDATINCDTARASQDLFCSSTPDSNSSPCFTTADPKKLTLLFKWLANHQQDYGMIICDIIFDNAEINEDNKELLSFINEIQASGPAYSKIIFSTIYDNETGQLQPGSFSNALIRNLGAVNEEQTGEFLFKYQLSYQDGKVKTLPLLMFENIQKVVSGPTNFGYYTYSDISKKSYLARNTFIPEMLISNEDIDSVRSLTNIPNFGSVDSNVGKIELWQSLVKCDGKDNFYLEQILKKNTHKKNIFIGGFNHKNHDIHKTLYGNMDGATILLNIYYGLLGKQNRIRIDYELFVFTCFYGIFLSLIILPHFSAKNFWVKLFFDLFVEKIHYIILGFMTIYANYKFNQVTNVIILTFVLFVFEKIIKNYKEVHPELIQVPYKF